MGRMPPMRLRFDRAAIPQLSSSGGTELLLVRAEFSPWWFLDKSVRPLRRPMAIFGDIRFTESDVTESTMVRDLVEKLVNIILTSPLPSWMREGLQVGEIDAVEISETNRIRVRGRLSTEGFSPPFSVSFGASIRGAGHVVVFDEFDLFLTPTYANVIKVYLPKSALSVELDLGRNARIDHLEIKGKWGVRIKGWARLSPVPSFRVSNLRAKNAPFYYKFDLSAMFSELFGISSPGP